MSLAALAERLAASRGLAHKADIAGAAARLGIDASSTVPAGDDCAAIPDGDGFLLFAIEGFLERFVAADPHFAGWCGIMVNLSDIAAMGGRPTAIADAIWSENAARALPLLDGLRAASAAYGVPIVGGHTNARADAPGLAVAVLGRARRLLTSFDARPGDVLIAAIDLRGGFRPGTPYWDAASGAPHPRLRADLDLLPALAEAGLSCAAKDISNAGLIGTAAMFADCSRVAITIDLTRVPRPDEAPIEDWLLAFPSYGFLLAASPDDAPRIVSRFAARDIAAVTVGSIEAGHALRITDAGESATVLDLAARPLLDLTRRLEDA